MAVLQWGRDQLIAEINLHRIADEQAAIASMGPRSADRGNRKDRIAKIPTVWLQ